MVKTRCSSSPWPARIAALTHDEVVQNLVDPGNASRKPEMSRLRVSAPLKADPVRDPADHQSRKAKFRYGIEMTLDGVFEAVRGLEGPMRPFLAFAPTNCQGTKTLADSSAASFLMSRFLFCAALAPLRCWHSGRGQRMSVRVLHRVRESPVSKNLLAGKNL